MHLSVKRELATVIREVAQDLESRREDRDKKLLRYNDIMFTYRVIKMLGGKMVTTPIDRPLIQDLVDMCDKSKEDYDPRYGPLAWAWTWYLPTTSRLKKFVA